jgi:hypothetical protein
MDTPVVTIKNSDIDMFTPPSSSHLNEMYTYYIRDQHKNNSCAVMALVSLIEYLRQIEGKEFMCLSDNFVYYNSMKINGNSEKGLKTCSVLRSILQYGACDQKRWSSIYDAHIRPTQNVIVESFSNLKDTTVEILECSIECMRYILGVCKRPISANIKMYNSCKEGNLVTEHVKKLLEYKDESESNDSDSDIESGGNCISKQIENLYNHSVLLVGYDDELQMIYFQNSYGKKWGKNGFGSFKYDYVKYVDSMYSMDESCIKTLDIEDEYKIIKVIEK